MKFFQILLPIIFTGLLNAQDATGQINQLLPPVNENITFITDTLIELSYDELNINFQGYLGSFQSYAVDGKMNLYILSDKWLYKYDTQKKKLKWQKKLKNNRFIYCYYYNEKLYVCGDSKLLTFGTDFGTLLKKRDFRQYGNQSEFQWTGIFPFFESYLLFYNSRRFSPGNIDKRYVFNLDKNELETIENDDRDFLWNCDNCDSLFLRALFGGRRLLFLGQSKKYMMFSIDEEPFNYLDSVEVRILNKESGISRIIDDKYLEHLNFYILGYCQFINDTTFVYPQNKILPKTRSGRIIFRKYKFHTW